MDMKYLFSQADYQMNLKLFDTKLWNYLDDKVDIVLIDAKAQYNIGKKAYDDFKEESSKVIDYQVDRNQIYSKYRSDMINLGLKDNIFALLETKIIYLWKIFEVKLKELINIAYDVDTKDFYYFDNIDKFLKQYKIYLKEINGYKLIIDLKEVNNQCKHQGLISSKKIKDRNIDEFLNCEPNGYISFEQAEIFYNRIKPIPELFLVEVKNEIIKERLAFDESKYIDIAIPLVKRMEHPEALRFIQILVDIYGFNSKQIDKLP